MKSNRSPTRFHHSVRPLVSTAEFTNATLDGCADGATYDGDTVADGDTLATPDRSTAVDCITGRGDDPYAFPVPYAHTTYDTPVNETCDARLSPLLTPRLHSITVCPPDWYAAMSVVPFVGFGTMSDER